MWGPNPASAYCPPQSQEPAVDDMLTLLAPRCLGAVHRADPLLGMEMARLHGRIIAREMRSVGVNYVCGTLSDLAFNEMQRRGLDTDSGRAADLIGEVVRGELSIDNILFATKHFPGQGLVVGDTHAAVKAAPAYSPTTADAVLAPFRSAIAASVDTGQEARLSIMIAHATFPTFDDTAYATISRKILGGMLRDDMRFSGVTISDAMWMAGWDKQPKEWNLRHYVQTFVAGMDLVVVDWPTYDSALRYFRSLGDGQLGTAEQNALSAQLGIPYLQLRERFLRRVAESRARLDAAGAKLGYPHETMDPIGSVPSSFTTDERARYLDIFRQVRSGLP